MSNWKQLKAFNHNKMGTAKGWCELNVAKGFGVDGKNTKNPMPSAKADMQFNKSKGTLHPMSEYPGDISVPVFLDTASQYEHVIADDKGALWSDGKRMASLKGYKVYGWGEWCNGVRVVEKSATPTPSGFLPAKGYWGRYDKDNRVAELAKFMRATFPAYTPASALGPVYGDNLWKSIKTFQQRSGMAKKDCDGNTGPKTYAMLKKYGFKG